MVDIEQTVYKKLAEQIAENLPDSGLLNSTFRIDIPEQALEVKLCLSAVVCSREIVPIWWECQTINRGVVEDNCFSWSELCPFLKELSIGQGRGEDV